MKKNWGKVILGKDLNGWSVIMVAVYFLMSVFVHDDSLFVYCLYFAMALPYYRRLDKLAVIYFLFSTLPDYFLGAYPNPISIYSIFALVAGLGMLLQRRRYTAKKIAMLFMVQIVTVFLSYLLSEFDYITGAFYVSYNILIALIVMGTVRFETETLRDFFPRMAGLIVALYLAVILATGRLVVDGLSIVENINHNGFGRSLAQLSVILAVKVFSKKGGQWGYKAVWALSVAMTLMTGSRNAFLALMIGCIFIYMYHQKRQRRTVNGMLILGFSISALLIAANLILPSMDFDLSRFNYVALIAGGGTNRVTIWMRLIPVIVQHYFWFGYGPGNYCTEQIVSPLVNRVFPHAHNTFLESWGQVGMIGLMVYVSIYWCAFRRIWLASRANVHCLVIFALMVALLVNGLGESMFTGLNLWFLLGICFARFPAAQKYERPVLKKIQPAETVSDA